MVDVKIQKQLKKIYEEIRKLQEMSQTREFWQDRTRSYLDGALGEYAKIIIAQNIGEKDTWSNEVRRLLSKIHVQMNPKRIVTSFKDRKKALREVFNESMIEQPQITDAKKELSVHFPKKRKQIQMLDLDSEDLFSEMIREYLPEYADLLD